jgi:hypothetical protein
LEELITSILKVNITRNGAQRWVYIGNRLPNVPAGMKNRRWKGGK